MRYNAISVSPFVYLVFALSLLIFPLRWVMGWILAVTLHELGHYTALRAFKIPIYSLSVTPRGLIMEIGEIGGFKAFVCALAGPVFSLMLLFIARWAPRAAFCAWVHSLFNLLPIYPLDGGRALRGLLEGCSIPYVLVERCVLLCLLCLFIYGLIYFRLGGLVLVALILIFAEKCLAKKGKKLYNKGNTKF